MAGKFESLRLVALPLSRRPRLTYYHAQRIRQTVPAAPAAGDGPSPAAGPSAKPAEGSGLLVRWMNKGTELGSRQWDALGKAPKGNWKWRIYMTGERMMDRIPFEEWALKGIDPALAPQPLRHLVDAEAPEPAAPQLDAAGAAGAQGGNAGQGPSGSGSGCGHVRVPFVYPPSLEDPDRLLHRFRSSLAARVPYHRKWMKLNLFLSPLTLPFALVPIVPNLPFFYMLWRSWSHWRALRASEYLQKLLSKGLILPTASLELDKVYASAEGDAAAASAASDAEAAGAAADGEPRMLLTKQMVPRVIGTLGLNDEAVTELNRAVDQAKARLRNLEPAQGGRAAEPEDGDKP